MAVKAIVFFDDEGNLEKVMMSRSLTNTIKERKTAEKLFAFILISIAIIVVLKDAYNIENGWVHPEMLFYHMKFLTNSTFEKFELSFGLEELRKLFWWEEVFDGSQNRILTGFFTLVDVKFRPWLFQFILPNPAVSLSWLLTLFFTPLLLYNFIRRYIGLDIVGSTAITVLFIASPTTVGNTFEYFHPGKILTVFFYILLLNIFMVVNDLDLSDKGNRTKRISFCVLAIITLFLSLFTDPYIYGIFFLLPVFFPGIFVDPPRFKYFLCSFKNSFFTKIRIIGIRRSARWFVNCLNLKCYGLYMIYGFVILGFSLSVFWILPQLASSAGFSYKFMQVFKSQIDSGADSPYLHFLNWHYYSAMLMNMYWAVVANIGLRDYLPIGIANLSNIMDISMWYSVFTCVNTLMYFLVHVMFWWFFFIVRYRYGLCRNVVGKVLALYLITAWITLVHGQYTFLVPYSTFIYGSPFSIFFAIFLGAMLYSFRRNKKVYLILVMAIFVSAVFSYQESKEMNRGLKDIWYDKDNIDIDMTYGDSRQLWNDIKYNGKTFDQNLLKIDERIRNNYLKAKGPHDEYYVKMWRELSINKKYLKAMHFAAFGND